jgi:hypothetical protein
MTTELAPCQVRQNPYRARSAYDTWSLPASDICAVESTPAARIPARPYFRLPRSQSACQTEIKLARAWIIFRHSQMFAVRTSDSRRERSEGFISRHATSAPRAAHDTRATRVRPARKAAPAPATRRYLHSSAPEHYPKFVLTPSSPRHLRSTTAATAHARSHTDGNQRRGLPAVPRCELCRPCGAPRTTRLE